MHLSMLGTQGQSVQLSLPCMGTPRYQMPYLLFVYAIGFEFLPALPLYICKSTSLSHEWVENCHSSMILHVLVCGVFLEVPADSWRH